jgi:flagellar biosynthesis anti-sigma factor FlgM
MNIENNTTNPASHLEALRNRAVAPTAAESPHAAKTTDEAFRVDISPTAEQVKSQDTDEISHDKVAAIRDRLAAGTYNISGKDVAKKILGVLK